MKKKRFQKKLSLNKETVSNLNQQEMKDSRAGEDKTRLIPSCETVLQFCCETGPNCKEAYTDLHPCDLTNNPFCASVIDAFCA